MNPEKPPNRVKFRRQDSMPTLSSLLDKQEEQQTTVVNQPTSSPGKQPRGSFTDILMGALEATVIEPNNSSNAPYQNVQSNISANAPSIPICTDEEPSTIFIGPDDGSKSVEEYVRMLSTFFGGRVEKYINRLIDQECEALSAKDEIEYLRRKVTDLLKGKKTTKTNHLKDTLGNKEMQEELKRYKSMIESIRQIIGPFDLLFASATATKSNTSTQTRTNEFSKVKTADRKAGASAYLKETKKRKNDKEVLGEDSKVKKRMTKEHVKRNNNTSELKGQGKNEENKKKKNK